MNETVRNTTTALSRRSFLLGSAAALAACSHRGLSKSPRAGWPQVSAMFAIAQAKTPPLLPPDISHECRDFLLLCFNRCAPPWVFRFFRVF